MKIEELLKERGIKTTSIRIKLIQILLDSDYPLQQKDIEDSWGSYIDRVTLYRNLKYLTSANIIHKIEVNESITSYNISEQSNPKLKKEHLHFHCVHCNKVICMPQHTIDDYHLPQGFMQSSKKLIIDGTCKWCNTN